MTQRNTTTRRVLASAIALAFGTTALLASCSGSGSSSDTTVPADSTPVITVSGQWARTSPAATTMGAAYMTIDSDADDELIGVAVDGSVAMKAELHEMVMAGDDDSMDHSSDTTMVMSDTTMAGGAMTMQKVDRIAVTAGEPLELKVGGYHIMLMDLAAPLEVGTSITVTLTFARAGDVTVEVPVLDEAPM